MAEYIDKQAVIDVTKKWFDVLNQNPDILVDSIKSIPDADVRENVRGRWGLDSDPGEPWSYRCSVCGEITKDTCMGEPRANFCPSCGADMRREHNETVPV